MKVNLKPIKKGATYSFNIKVWTDEARTSKLDISGKSFALKAVNGAGVEVINLVNSDFIPVDNFERRVTLSKNTTAAYPAGELYYQLDVTNADNTSDEWFDGYINIIP